MRRTENNGIGPNKLLESYLKVLFRKAAIGSFAVTLIQTGVSI